MTTPLAAYLAKNYLTADAAPKKKKKRKHATDTALIIADDDSTGWDTAAAKPSSDEYAPTIVGGSSAAPKTTKANWIITDEATRSAEILAANTDGVVKMESGAHAGLQSGEQVAAQLAAAKRAELARFAAEDPKMSGKGSDTIYRDASGRVINIAMARAEARRAEVEKVEKEERGKEALRGDVQKRGAEERRRELKGAKYLGLARYADDVEMNREMKEREVWNDPAAAFLTKKREGAGKTYLGAAEPNRFGIRPGHRWDGVDRGNGFERKWFAAQNRKREKAERSYTSQMDID